MTGVFTLLAAWALWFIALVFFSPPERAWKGHFGRHFVRLPLIRKLHSSFEVWIVFWALLFGISELSVHNAIWVYVIDAARRLDDYFNYDDDSFRRFFAGVRNRVKWKMKLPQTSV